jgi:hypothetical protein
MMPTSVPNLEVTLAASYKVRMSDEVSRLLPPTLA